VNTPTPAPELTRLGIVIESAVTGYADPHTLPQQRMMFLLTKNIDGNRRGALKGDRPGD